MSNTSGISGLPSERDAEQGLNPFAAAFRAIGVPMLITDPQQPDNPITFVNDAFSRLTGYSQQEAEGRNCRFLQGPETDPQEVRRIREAVAAGEGIEVEILNYRKDGTSFRNALAITPVRDEHGILVHFCANQRDVTDQRRAQAELQAAQAASQAALEEEVARRTEALQAALEDKTALVREVDHRVKNSLQVVTSLVLLKARRLKDKDARRVLNDLAERVGALAAAHRLLSAMNDVNHFNLQDFIVDVGGDLMSAQSPGQIDLDLSVEPVSVAASKAAPMALLLNELMSNALRHAFPEGRRGRLSVAVWRREADVHIRIEDDGIGLPGGPGPSEAFGMMLIDMLVRQLRANILWENAGPGTRALIVMPLGPEDLGSPAA